jgi:D-arabinan exo alpha-(1,3)/(1,5)-arabinofuranosidase (non-reducing end)
MTRRLSILALVLLGLLCASLAAPVQAAENLSYSDLVGRMTDLQQPAVLPAPGETCKQWASWERSSKYDADSGKYIDWAANGDGTGLIRKEDGREVMAEMEGPGCIWRIWSARALDGHVKIYLDGNDEPTVDLPFKNYFTGDTAPFNFPAASYDLIDNGCRGQNLYLPIPYQKSCKIVADEGWGRYYQFVYTTFAKGTKVPTFSGDLVAKNADALQEYNDQVAGRVDNKAEGLPTGPDIEHNSLRVAGGVTAKVVELTGPRTITSIRAKLPLGDRDDEMAALRELCLQVTFDGEKKPAVWCPLGDFFGTAPGKNLYTNWVTGMTDDCFYANWAMPFGKNAVVELVNDGKKVRDVELTIVHEPIDSFEGLGHFHCKWHRDVHPLPEDRWPDWTMIKTEGRGRFMGVMLHVWNPRGGWWGEGDEKFFIDGEKFPSTFGTGSEDYFGYAWCDPGLFQRPFHSQSMTMGNKGHQSVLRWHVADNVPFQTSFEGCIEKYYRTEEKGTLYACTVCWYLAPGGVDPYGPVPVEDRHDYYVKLPAFGGGFRILGDPAGDPHTQKMTNYREKWAKGDQLWWTGAKPGDKLQIALPVESDGCYDVSVILTKAVDYGIVQLSIDGKKMGEPIDLFNQGVIRTDAIPLGQTTLTKGEHVLGVEILGKNENAVPRYMFGLDEVLLKKAK